MMKYGCPDILWKLGYVSENKIFWSKLVWVECNWVG